MLRRVAHKQSLFGGAGIRPNDHVMDVGRIPVKADRDVTDEDLTHFNLILFGTAEDNALVARMIDRFRLTLSDNTLAVGKREAVSLDGAGIRLHHFNPLNPRRLIFWVATGERGDKAEEWMASHRVMTGSSTQVRVNQSDLIVQGLDGRMRRAMQFTHDWRWHELPGADVHVPIEMASARSLLGAHARAWRRATGAEYVILWGAADDDPLPFDPQSFTLADMATARVGEPTWITELTGAELIDARNDWIAKKIMTAWPAFEVDDIDPDRIYRVAMPYWTGEQFRLPQGPPHHVTVGPTIRLQDVWIETFGDIPAELKGPTR